MQLKIHNINGNGDLWDFKISITGNRVKKSGVIENVFRKDAYIDKCINIIRDDDNYTKETGHDVFMGKSKAENKILSF